MPFEVILLAVVGAGEVLQHIPRAVTVAPPSLVTLPPPEAVFELIAEMAVVVIVGNWAKVVKLISLP